MMSRITICVALLASSAFGVTIEFQDASSGDYRIERILDVDGGDGYFYTITPQRTTYEELQEFHVFEYPGDVLRHQINLEFDYLGIPLQDVVQEPVKTYWIDQPWTYRMDATYEIGFMVPNINGIPGNEPYLNMRGWEYDTLGASLGDSWVIEYPFMAVSRTLVAGTLPGDFDDNGIVDAFDIDHMQRAIRNHDNYDPTYDWNHNLMLQGDDFDGWLATLFVTSAGDANLDHLFNSTDLIQLFAAGEYEDGVAFNSVWTTGDFNYDADFTSSDLVRALEQGTYQSEVAAVVVPEPSAIALIVMGCLLLLTNRKG